MSRQSTKQKPTRPTLTDQQIAELVKTVCWSGNEYTDNARAQALLLLLSDIDREDLGQDPISDAQRVNAMITTKRNAFTYLSGDAMESAIEQFRNSGS